MKHADLVVQHLPLALRVARFHSKQTKPFFELDDLYGAAVDGLVNAARTFEPARGDFKQRAMHSIATAVIEFKRRFGPYTRTGINRGARAKEGTVNQYEMLGLGFEVSLPERAFDKPLTNREKHVVKLRFVLDLTQMETAREMGVTEGRIGQIERATLARFRVAYKRMGITRLEQIL